MNMHYFPILSIAVLQLFLTKEVVSEQNDVLPAGYNFLGLINRYCESPLFMDSTTMSPEEVKEDQDFRSAISEFTIPRIPIRGLFEKEHLTGSDILSFLNENEFRQTFCSKFVPIESALIGYVRSREKCLFRIDEEILIMLAAFRTLCATDFEETLKDVLQNVGDNCVDSLFQNFQHRLSLEDRRVCQETAAKLQNGDEPLLQYRKYFPEAMKNCMLIRVQRACGDDAEVQFKRLSDRLGEALNF